MATVREVEQNPLALKPIKSLIWKFALPGIVGQLVNAVYNIVDQIFVGWGIGDLGIAATTIVFPLATITTALSVLFGSGAAAKFSLLMGEKNADEGRSTIGNVGFWLALLRQGLLLLPLLFILPRIFGIDGLLFAGPVTDGTAAIIVVICGAKQVRKLTELQKQSV